MTHTHTETPPTNDITVYPEGEPTVEQMPDGRFLVEWAWPGMHLAAVVDLEQLRTLNRRGLDAEMLARDPALAPERSDLIQ